MNNNFETRLKEYLDNIKNYSINVNDLYLTFFNDILEMSEYSGSDSFNSNEEKLSSWFYDYFLHYFYFFLVQNECLIISKNSKYYYFNKNQAKILTLFYIFGLIPNFNGWDFKYSLTREKINYLFGIYNFNIDENVKELEKLCSNEIISHMDDLDVYQFSYNLKNIFSGKSAKDFFENIQRNLNAEIIDIQNKSLNEIKTFYIEQKEKLESLEQIYKEQKEKLKSSEQLYTKQKEKLNLLEQIYTEQKENLKSIKKEVKNFKSKYDLSTLYSVSTMGIFLSIFSLIGINVGFFKDLENKNLYEISALICILNGTLLLVITLLISLIKHLFDNNFKFSKICALILPPIIFIGLGLILIA